LNNKILSIKRNSAIFLAGILIAGTIALFIPSFTTTASAQSEPYYRDNSYGPEPREYPPEYSDSNNYNSYEPEYGMDSYKKSYGNNNYEQPQYPSYQQDYKQEYPKYVKDNNGYKSKKDSSSSVSINKLSCVNNNVNINGNNNGDINVGNSGSSAATNGGNGEGYLGVGSSGSYGEEGYGNGYNKEKGKSFTCIINNNNNNTIVTGNVTDGNETETQPCEDCILDSLSPEQEIDLAEAIQFLTDLTDLEALCEFLADETINPVIKDDTLSQILLRIGVPMDIRDDIRDCLNELGFDIFVPPILTGSGLSNLPTIAQGTEDSAELTATEKITKLKQQWLELLP
jgi:hypothetical protein